MDCLEAHEFRVEQAAPLTKREAEVLLWTAEGKTAWEAGRILGVTEGTTRIHLSRALEKLNASNKTHAVARAFSVGILARKAIAAILLMSGCVMPTIDAEATRVPRRPPARTMRAGSLAGPHSRFKAGDIAPALLDLYGHRLHALEQRSVGRKGIDGPGGRLDIGGTARDRHRHFDALGTNDNFRLHRAARQDHGGQDRGGFADHH